MPLLDKMLGSLMSAALLWVASVSAAPLDKTRQAIERGAVSEAHSVLDRYLTDNPDDPEALVLRGRVEFEALRAQEYFDRVTQVAPTHPVAAEAMVEIAHYWFARGRYNAARPKAERVIENFPDSRWALDARLIVGRCLLATQQYGLAAETLAPLLRHGVPEPVRRAGAASLARAYSQSGRPAQAVRALTDPAFETDVYLLSLLIEATKKADRSADLSELMRQHMTLKSQIESRPLADAPPPVTIAPLKTPTETPPTRQPKRTERKPPTQVAKTPPTAAPEEPVDRFAGGFKGWSVQVGAFTDRRKAVRLRAKLVAEGYASAVVTAPNGLNRVWVGNAETRADVEEQIEPLKALLKLTPFVVPNQR
ncbi:MAG: tetratricopeptide repeat protein [Candidatus Latescibacteria bacterium]|nr:tetratricopeptide repeat protein [Candidatus Latescibacterota bacterium]